MVPDILRSTQRWDLVAAFVTSTMQNKRQNGRGKGGDYSLSTFAPNAEPHHNPPPSYQKCKITWGFILGAAYNTVVLDMQIAGY